GPRRARPRSRRYRVRARAGGGVRRRRDHVPRPGPDRDEAAWLRARRHAGGGTSISGDDAGPRHRARHRGQRHRQSRRHDRRADARRSDGHGRVKIGLRSVSKKFGTTTAVDLATLDIGDGELFTLLGPSGCGKTTLLRLIAGFYRPDVGEIWFGERRVDGLAPHARNIGMVFQNYALWPHMTVALNITYGLKLRKLSAAEIGHRLAEGLRKVNLTGLADRYPGQLSGGQQRRVALARPLVLTPDILLLDEPLSNLDAKIRVQVRGEIRTLQKELGITTVYVTHDQEEALSLSDRVAVM